jgi:glycosyltransferase involved in cell wall biosynthesis
VVEHGRTGLLFPAGDPAALAVQILTAARDAGMRAAIGEKSRQRVVSQSVERVSSLMAEALGRVIENHSRKAQPVPPSSIAAEHLS